VSDDPDLAGLLETLDRHRVAYVVAGSVGALAHGAPDVEPGDLDIVPATDAPNLVRLDAVLVELEAVAVTETGAWQTDEAGEHRWIEDGVARPVRPRDADDPDSFDHSFATRAGRLDVVPRVAGSYEALRSRAERRTIAGREAWVAHPIDLLAGLTGPRPTRDGPRVQHLRQAAAARSRRTGWRC
jgi:hypothetical protein